MSENQNQQSQQQQQNNTEWKPRYFQEQKPQQYSDISPEEAKKKWGDKIFTMGGKPKSSQENQEEELLESIRQENIKGKMNYYTKIRQQDKVANKGREYIYKEDPTLSKDIPIDGDFVAGSTIFTRNCSACHMMAASSQERHNTGPALGLLYGKRAGSDQYYRDYSDSLVNTRLVWNQRSLFHFLKDPQAYIKGNKCNSRVESEEDRADLLAFMKTYSKGLSKNMRIRASKVYGKAYVDIQLQSQKLIDNNLQNVKND